MARCEIIVKDGSKRAITISLNVPNNIVDLWQEDKFDEARMELDYHITKHFESLYNKEKKQNKQQTLDK